MPEFCRLESAERILTVTIDRPEVLNSLHSEASYELAQVFDDFESNEDLWVAIITGCTFRINPERWVFLILVGILLFAQQGG